MGTPKEIETALDEISKGNRDAYWRVVETYGLPLRSYLASQVFHLDDADELAQEVFLAAFRNIADFRRGDDFGAWLRGIARNKLLHHFRANSRRANAMDRYREEVIRIIAGDLEKTAADSSAEWIEALLVCIAKLPDKLRKIVRSGLQGSRPATLAVELETSVGAIYTLHYRANQLLRECVRREVDHG